MASADTRYFCSEELGDYLSMIDMRSDTVSLPTPEMRRAMSEAEVGDDVYGDDPTIRALENKTAELLGKESAVYMPTGTMSNQAALRTHTESGDQVLADINAHIFHNEGGAPAALSGLNFRPLMGRKGIFTAADVHQAIPVPHPFMPTTVSAPTSLLCVENTHNAGGGTIWPLAAVREVTSAARAHGLRCHLDGARLWHASAATGTPELEYAASFDTVNVCFSKGLGAPMGSALAGSAEIIARARRFKQMFGGGFRQAGIVAAGALYALENHRERLVEDHINAGRFAEGLAEISGIDTDAFSVQSNIIRFRVTTLTATAFVDDCHSRGLYLLPNDKQDIRAVTHLDVTKPMVEEALTIIRQVMSAH
jgi:threonine aldolase